MSFNNLNTTNLDSNLNTSNLDSNLTCIPFEEIKEKNIENKTYIIKYSTILIIISLTLAIISILDFYKEWTAKDSELLVFLYGINWFVLALNIMYFINTAQRSNLFGSIISKFNIK